MFSNHHKRHRRGITLCLLSTRCLMIILITDKKSAHHGCYRCSTSTDETLAYCSCQSRSACVAYVATGSVNVFTNA